MARDQRPVSVLLSRTAGGVSSRVRRCAAGQPDYWVLAFARSLIFEAKSITWNV
jgi:hypothetical protein